MASAPRNLPFEDLFNDLARGFLVRPIQSVAEQAQPGIRVDVEENERGFTVRADLPGVRKEDIQVDVQGNHVRLRAEVRKEEERREGGRVVYSERSVGMQTRSFDLPEEVNADGAQAEYRDGVLRLTLPKKANVASRRISIA